MKWSWKFIVLATLLFLSACERETEGYTGVNLDTPKVRISASVNTKGEIQLSGAYVIKEFDAGKLGRVSWEVGITETLRFAQSKTNTLFILYEEDGQVIRQMYDFGQPFEITFGQDQWVRKLENDGRGNTVVFVEKRVASPSEKEPKSNIEAPQSNDYWCDDLDKVRLNIGDDAKVLWMKINLRSTPVVPDTWDANIVAQLDKGIRLTIIGGPECAHEGTWWEVQTENGDYGWSREYTESNGYLIGN